VIEKKFRAWDKANKQWYGESSQWIPTFTGFAIFGECTLLTPPPPSDLINLEITQYVGIKDKHDIDVYEKDIVGLTFKADPSYTSIVKVQARKFQIEFWNDNKFKQSWGVGESFFSMEARALGFHDLNFDGVEIEVLGHTYLNAELLEKRAR